jgi:hypothetical protein
MLECEEHLKNRFVPINTQSRRIKYIDQTGHTLWTRCNECVKVKKSTANNSKYSSHILENTHTSGPTEEDLDVLENINPLKTNIVLSNI